MKIVIQCAGKKDDRAGYFRGTDGRKVMFVGDPGAAPDDGRIYACPDDVSDSGKTWRAELLAYNEAGGDNPFRLLPAWRLYSHPTYRLLKERYGVENLYILSAGWGLIPATFLTPNYDITFSAQGDKYVRRRKKDHYDDFQMLPDDGEAPVVFFVSKSYVELACALTQSVKAPKVLFYGSMTPPVAPGCILQKYNTTTRTNWQYECAKAFIDGRIGI